MAAATTSSTIAIVVIDTIEIARVFFSQMREIFHFSFVLVPSKEPTPKKKRKIRATAFSQRRVC